MAKKDSDHATLTLTITYNTLRIIDIIEAAKEVIEKASELGAVEGYLDLHRAEPIFVEDLR